MKSTAIAKKHREQLAQTTGEQPGPKLEEIIVIEPGPNPPTYAQVAKAMLAKITVNTPDIINALIKLAKGGHYQAAQYLLNEMKELNEELAHTDEQSVVELFRPVIERLNAKYRKPTVIDADCEDDVDTAAAITDSATDDAQDPEPDSDTDAYDNAVSYFGRNTLPPAEAPPISALEGASPVIAQRDAGCYCGSECSSCRPSSDSASNP